MLRPWREVAAGYDAAAPGYDSRHGDPVSLARSRILDGPLLEAAAGAPRVLDLGAGTGRLLRQVATPFPVGIDVSHALLQTARHHGGIVARADAHCLPFPDAAFDAVLAAKGVFRYLEQDGAFAESARVLRRGGLLALQQFGARTWTLRHHRSPAAGVCEVE